MNSSEATRQVSSYIRTIQQEATRVSQSVEQNTQKVVMQTELVMQTGVALDAIFVVTEQLTNLIQGICTTAESQAQGSDVVMNAVGEIEHMTGDVTIHMHEMQQSTSQLLSLSNSLRSKLTGLRIHE
jgi:methyl-accepting chemotaxis protein